MAGEIAKGAPYPPTLTYIVVAIVLVLFMIYLLFISWKCHSGSVWDEAFDDSASTNSSPSSSSLEKRVKTKDLSFLPEFVHGTTDGGEKQECAVCITEFVDGQIGRLLPICGHKYHKECVDKWFREHSTCPICRTIVNENKEGEKICFQV